MTVYEPAEDSELLRDFLKSLDLEGKKALDMGTGSGIQAIHMAENGAKVTAADINQEAVEKVRQKADSKNLGIKVVKSDLFENIEEEFELIVFNPPYLPGKKGLGDEEVWRGGEKGTEITERFLEQVDGYLSQQGGVYIVLSSLADYESLVEKFELELLDSEELWFETLFVALYR